jgi:hypothetical protein
MLFEELIDRATQAAVGPAGTPEQVDRDITAEVVYPHAVRKVYRDHAKTGRHINNLMNEYVIEVVDGEATLPDEILREYLGQSYLPRLPFASLVPFEDFGRYRFNNQMAYYALRGNKIVYSGPTIANPITCTAIAGSPTITGDASRAQVGDRLYLFDGVRPIVDAMISSINGTVNFTVRGNAINTTTGPTEGILYNGQNDVLVRSVSDLTVNTGSRNVTSATAAFTSADEGRRLKAYPSYVPDPNDPGESGAAIVGSGVDAIIESAVNATTAMLRAKPLANAVGLVCEIYYTPLVLQAVGVPPLPENITDELSLSPEVAEDTIVTIAQVLRGEIPLQALVDLGMGNGSNRKR